MPVPAFFPSVHTAAKSRAGATWRLWAAGVLGLSLLVAAPVRAARDDVVGATMAGEFALQAGKLDESARWYLVAARTAKGDAGLAERAARIALLANDDSGAADALKLWRQRAPESLALRAAEVTLALRQGDERAARRALDALLRHGAAGTDQAKGATGPAATGLAEESPAVGWPAVGWPAVGWQYALAALGGSGARPQLAAKLLGELVDAGSIPNELQAWLAFGGLAQRLQQPALASRIVAIVLARFPNEPRVALLHASQLREAGNPAAAKAILAGLEAETRDNPDLRLSVAAEYDALGDLHMAASVLARGEQDDDTYRLRASLLARADDKAALGDLYAELQRDSSNPDPQRRLLLGQAAEFLERYDDALQWYRSVPGGEQRWQARLREANVLHELKRSDQAYAQLRELQADASAEDDTRRDAYLLEADLRQKDNQDAGELDVYARGLAAFPDDGALLYARALGWERREDIARAEADLRRLLVGDPENVAALNALGYTLADRTTRYTEALELIDRARAADPDSPAIVDSYGWALYRLGRVDEALVQLRRAFALQKDPEIAAHLGEVLWHSGHKAEARGFFDQSRKLDPDNRALQRAMSRTGA